MYFLWGKKKKATNCKQMALQSLALSYYQLGYCESLGFYPFVMNGSKICFL